MRLAPIERPPTLLGKLITYATKREVGRAITPAQVVYNRVPAAWRISLAFLRFELFGAKLDHELRLLATTHVAMLNGCAFCQDIKRALAVRQKLGIAKFDALAEWKTSTVFSARERAALAFVEEATLGKRVSDATFSEAQKHFDERAIVELTLSAAVENFYNLVNGALEIESDGLEALARAAAR
jgi:alkylhydroperoxidase family enzyme